MKHEYDPFEKFLAGSSLWRDSIRGIEKNALYPFPDLLRLTEDGSGRIENKRLGTPMVHEPHMQFFRHPFEG
jgi:hypothetical protein